MSWIIAGIVAVVAIIMMVVIGLILSKLYVRAHKDTAYVRTGLGGQKVVKDGGSLVIGIFQNITHVNMRTLKLTISRREKESLITKDRLRIDIAVDFFVRVKPDSDSIAVAAQTLGDLTMQPDQLRNLIEPKLVDVLRSVAATMEMEQIHEQRQEFVQSVQTVLASDIAKNGLELETVSLTSLDQTDHRHFNPDNAFDAEGMRKLVEITQGNMKRRNDIQRDTEVAIAMRDRDAEMEQLNIKQATEEARLNQERDIALKTADQQTLIAQSEASAKQRSELARIEADKQIRDAEIASNEELSLRQIDSDMQLRQRTIETARITEEADVSKDQAVAIAKQNSAIQIAEREGEKAQAEANANKARAEAVKAEEEIATNREMAIAERRRITSVIDAKSVAEVKATEELVKAEAEKKAAEDRAAAIKTIAEGNRQKSIIEAEAEASRIKQLSTAEAESITITANAKKTEYEVEAAYKRDIIAAGNSKSDSIVEHEQRLALIERLPDIIAEQVKPITSIDSIRVLSMPNMPGQGGGTTLTDKDGNPIAASSINIPSIENGNLVNDLLRFQMMSPLVKQMTDTIGIDLSKWNGSMTPFIDGNGEITKETSTKVRKKKSAPSDEQDDAVA